jgi:flagellar FliJ protein
MTLALHTLLEHAERERDETMAALLHAEEAARRLRVQADQLHAYRDEYRLRGPAHGGRSAPIELLRCHQGFMQRLEQALGQQQATLLAAQARVAEQRSALLAQEIRVASVRKLLERRGEDHQRAAARLEQRRHDDDAVQRLWRDNAQAQAALPC